MLGTMSDDGSLMSEIPNTARDFQAGVVLPNVAGGGHLRVSSGRIELTTGPLSKWASGTTSIVHQGLDIDLYRALLMPPWMSRSLVVSDGRQTGLATFPTWMRKSIQSALEGNGFNVRVITTRFDRGFGQVKA
jgi:hypothetical protein